MLDRLGWNDRLTELFAPHLESGLAPGRVVRVDRDRVTVATADDEIVARAQPLPAVGDWVALTAEARVAAILPRYSELSRTDPERPAPQVLAVNVDVVLVVAALDPQVNLRRLERTVTMSWESGAAPAVVLTKPDRCPDLAGCVAAVEAVVPGADVVVVNGKTGEGVDGLRDLLARRGTAVLIGASGAGKSTLANHLLGEDERLATGSVREGDRRGRHTTTARQLVTLPGGGAIIDTPGLRALEVWDASAGLAEAFSDIETLAADCRFRDCRHGPEPGCAVAGNIDPDRLENWRQLSEPLDPAEQRRRAKVMAKGYRRDLPK